ncbi:cell well associated RhsD protein [Prevotella sp. MGM1]|nr:cell well associated RhsD protein [Prevotella sp. MGM1]
MDTPDFISNVVVLVLQLPVSSEFVTTLYFISLFPSNCLAVSITNLSNALLSIPLGGVTSIIFLYFENQI